jgi:glycosyltransferase involved in cell wall biosynthesis
MRYRAGADVATAQLDLIAGEKPMVLIAPSPYSKSCMRPQFPTLVVITPVYNESAILPHYVEAVSQTLLNRRDLDARILLVDDGSDDNSWRLIQQVTAGSDRFSGVRLSRNFGAHTALTAGFDHVPADADAVATLACDLQDPPEVILDFIAQWRAGAEIVWGARRSRADSGWRQTASRLLEGILRRYAMPRNSLFQTGSFFLVDRVVVDCFRQFREHARSTFALVAWTGFDQAVVGYDRRPRIAGRSGWTFLQMVNSAYDVFMGFSLVPAKLFAILGFVMFFASVTAGVYLVTTWLFHDVLPGWTGLITTMTLCFGILFMMVGFIFEYLSRILVETKQRPLYFVSRRIGATFGERIAAQAIIRAPFTDPSTSCREEDLPQE